jgi:hypothetical protein
MSTGYVYQYVLNGNRVLHNFAVRCSDNTDLPVLSDIKKFRQMYSCPCYTEKFAVNTFTTILESKPW